MNRRYLRSGVAIAAALMLQVALGDDTAVPNFTPPRLRNRGVDTDSCFPDRARQPRLSRFDVNVTVMPDGSVTDVTLPAASEPWQDETARCVLGRVTFIAGTRDGLPVAAQATMPIVAKTKLGDVSSPKLRSSNETLEAAYRACYPADLLSMTSAFYGFTVATNGRVSDSKVVKSSGDTRLDEAGVCILKMLEFAPLMQDGRGMKSIVTWELPIRPPR